eukprot:3179141-Rhodomonas_salina.1
MARVIRRMSSMVRGVSGLMRVMSGMRSGNVHGMPNTVHEVEKMQGMLPGPLIPVSQPPPARPRGPSGVLRTP